MCHDGRPPSSRREGAPGSWLHGHAQGIDGLAMLVQGVLQQDPFTGHLFVFRGRTRANLIKIIFWDGTGLCLFTRLSGLSTASSCGLRASFPERRCR